MALLVCGSGFTLLHYRGGRQASTRAVVPESVTAAGEEVEKVELGGSDVMVTKLGIGAWS